MSAPSSASPPTPTQQPKVRWDFAEQALKVGTGSFAVIYAAGFLVVSIHHSQYHIVMFEFLRARVFAAGLLFAFFLILPVIAASRLFGLLGLGKVVEIKEEHREIARLMMGCGFYVIASSMAYFSKTLFSPKYAQTHNALWVVATPTPIIAVVVFKYWVERHPNMVRFVIVLTFNLSLYATWKAYSGEMFLVCLWFFVVGNLFWFLHTKFSRSEGVRTHNWELSFLYSLVFVAVFANSIYGSIRPEWGGGLPTPVTIHFSRSTSFSNSMNTPVQLIDETDKGFYLTHTPDDHKASFIPREAIASADFEETQ